MTFNPKRIIVGGIIAVDVIVLLVLGGFYVDKVQKTAVLDVALVPRTAVLKIGGDEFRQGVFNTYPGKVTAVISAQGFEDKIIELNLNSETTTKVHEFLTPTKDNMNYYAKNEDDFEAMQKIGGEEAQRISNLLSIRKVLPIINYQYNGLNNPSKEIIIDQDLSCEDVICLRVTGAGEDDIEEVETMIKNKGYNPEDYKIIWRED